MSTVMAAGLGSEGIGMNANCMETQEQQKQQQTMMVRRGTLPAPGVSTVGELIALGTALYVCVCASQLQKQGIV